MEKYAVIELNADILRLLILDVEKGGYFNIYDEIIEPVKIGRDVDTEGLIKPVKLQETLKILKLFRKVCDQNKITKVVAVATSVIRNAKNQKSFLEEIYNNTAFNFVVLPIEDEVRAVYSGVVNSVDIQKGVMIDIEPMATYILTYNRRTLLNQISMPIGSFNLAEKFFDISEPAKRAEAMVSYMRSEFAKYPELKDFDEEVAFIGAGNSFLSIGKIAKKVSRYPLDVDNNYVVSEEVLNQVYETVKELDLDKTKKLKGVSEDRADALMSGISISKAFLEAVNGNQISISASGFKEGIIYNYVVPEANEKPLSDMLGYSLETIAKFYNRPASNNAQVYNLSLLLFKQLKVMHKLPRSYVKALRIASSMYDCGTRVKFENSCKCSFDIILNSNLFGISHRELLISAFACMCQNTDNFNLGDWVRYKDILREEDLDAVRKIGAVIRLAAALDASKSSCVVDINCDILGDSVIMKTIVEGNADFEIMQGMKLATIFRKIFKKNLRII